MGGGVSLNFGTFTHMYSQEKIRGQRGTIRALAGISRFYFKSFLTLDGNERMFPQTFAQRPTVNSRSRNTISLLLRSHFYRQN